MKSVNTSFLLASDFLFNFSFFRNPQVFAYNASLNIQSDLI